MKRAVCERCATSEELKAAQSITDFCKRCVTEKERKQLREVAEEQAAEVEKFLREENLLDGNE